MFSKLKFNHLLKIKQSYFQHLFDALSFSFISLKASFIFLIHGLYPDIFETKGGELIENIYLTIQKKKRELLNN
jgi:hypothetical protein